MPVVTIYREVGYEGALTAAKEIAEDLDVDIGFKPAPRICHKKCQFSSECEDETVHNPEVKFKIEFFSQLLDTVQVSLEERFE